MRIAAVGACLSVAPVAATEPAQPVVEGRWVRPAPGDGPATPEWGHARGLRVGIAPLPGPRGLLRIYLPDFDHPSPKVLNFIAVEPIPKGARDRGYSELEHSALDNAPGKRFWSSDSETTPVGASLERSARGVIDTIEGVEQLSVFIGVERFNNGADVYLRLLFREDRPGEVGVSAFALEGSAPIAQCILTATMGNYARLRILELAERQVRAGELWPHYRGDGFTAHATYPLNQLRRLENGDAYVSAVPDEADPGGVDVLPGTNPGWRYKGPVLRQYWRMPNPPEDLRACVNGRFTYWASQSPIPGGIAFENFELIAPFEQGQTFWFGVEPLTSSLTQPASAQPHQPPH